MENNYLQLFTLDGSLKVDRLEAKTVVAGDYVVRKEIGEDDNTTNIGTGEILENEMEVTIKTDKINENSKVFISFIDNLEGRSWFIAEKNEGEGFKVSLSAPAQKNLRFDWWIVKTE